MPVTTQSPASEGTTKNGNGNNRFHWHEERWQRINTLVHDDAAKVRVARRVIPLYGNGDGSFVGNADSYEISTTPRLSIRPGKTLLPIVLEVEFQLSPEQFEDEEAAEALASRAAYILALAEDAIILQGASASLDPNVLSRNLGDQKGLFAEKQPDVERPILESMLEAIKQLRLRNHHGPFCAIVSPDLWQEAHTRDIPKGAQISESRPLFHRDAPICEILPLLQEGGFHYSSAALGKTGVVFSLGGRTVDMTVSVDSMIQQPAEEERGIAILRVVEQFRLRINDSSAVVALS